MEYFLAKFNDYNIIQNIYIPPEYANPHFEVSIQILVPIQVTENTTIVYPIE